VDGIMAHYGSAAENELGFSAPARTSGSPPAAVPAPQANARFCPETDGEGFSVFER